MNFLIVTISGDANEYQLYLGNGKKKAARSVANGLLLLLHCV